MERAFRAYGKSIENASKKRIKGGKEKDEPMTAVEFVLLSKRALLTAEEIENWNIGTIIDFVQIRNKSMIKNKSLYSDEQRYKQLKALEPEIDVKYKKGIIPKAKYDRFKQQLSEWG